MQFGGSNELSWVGSVSPCSVKKAMSGQKWVGSTDDELSGLLTLPNSNTTHLLIGLRMSNQTQNSWSWFMLVLGWQIEYMYEFNPNRTRLTVELKLFLRIQITKFGSGWAGKQVRNCHHLLAQKHSNGPFRCCAVVDSSKI